MTTALEEGERSAARPGRSLPPGKTRYPLDRRLGGPQGRSGRTENLAPTGIRSPDRSAHSSVTIPTELPGPLHQFVLHEKGYHYENIADFIKFYISGDITDSKVNIRNDNLRRTRPLNDTV